MRAIITLTVAVLAMVFGLTQPARAQQTNSAEDGVLIYSVSSIAIAMNFSFSYQRVAAPDGSRTSDRPRLIECRCVGFFRAQMADPDFTGRATGKVIAVRVPAGQYEVFQFGFGGSVAGTGLAWSSRKPFSLPFTVRPGEATYIGSFARAPSLGTPLQPQLGAAGYFIVSDESERDLKIARDRDPALPPVRTEVTDVTQFDHPALRRAEP